MIERWLTNHNDLVEVFPRLSIRGRRWHWHCAAPNGELLEWGEAYVRRIDAVKAAERHHPRFEDDGFEACRDCGHLQHEHGEYGCEWCACEMTWAGEEE